MSRSWVMCKVLLILAIVALSVADDSERVLVDDTVGKSEYDANEGLAAANIKNRGEHAYMENGKDLSNVKTSASLTATVTANDDHSDVHSKMAESSDDYMHVAEEDRIREREKVHVGHDHDVRHHLVAPVDEGHGHVQGEHHDVDHHRLDDDEENDDDDDLDGDWDDDDIDRRDHHRHHHRQDEDDEDEDGEDEDDDDDDDDLPSHDGRHHHRHHRRPRHLLH